AETFGERRSVHFVYIRSSGQLQKTFQHRTCNRGRIDFVYFSAVVHVQSIDTFRHNLGEKPAKSLAEAKMWPDDRQCSCVEIWHVDGVADRTFEKRGTNGLRNLDANTFLRLRRRCAKMRSEN